MSNMCYIRNMMIMNHRFFIFLTLWFLYRSSLSFCNSNATEITTSEIPPVVPQPRLPVLYQTIESNATVVTYPESEAKTRKTVDIKEVHEIPDEGVPEKNASRTTNTHYESSPTISKENYISIGENTQIPKFSKYTESGFIPFVPSPQFNLNLDTTPHNHEYNSEHFKSSIPAKQEQFYKPYFNNYPTYGEVQNFDLYEPSSYTQYQHGEQKLPYITTFAPPTVTPVRHPPLSFYETKPHIHMAEIHDELKTNEYSQGYTKYQSDFNSLGLGVVSGQGFGLDDSYNVFHKHTFSDKPNKKRSSLLHILMTLLPLGLLLSSLPPRVVFVNSTNSRQPPGYKPQFRNFETELLNMSNVTNTAYNLVTNIGLEPSDDPPCNKLKFCETESSGLGGKSHHSVTNYGLWHLLSRLSHTVRSNLHLQDVYEAIMEKKCSRFVCTETAKEENQIVDDKVKVERDLNDANKP